MSVNGQCSESGESSTYKPPPLPPSHPPPQWGLLTYERDPWEPLGFDPQQLIWVLHAHVF